jgi:hypothetical protein
MTSTPSDESFLHTNDGFTGRSGSGTADSDETMRKFASAAAIAAGVINPPAPIQGNRVDHKVLDLIAQIAGPFAERQQRLDLTAPGWKTYLNSALLKNIDMMFDSDRFGSVADPDSVRARWTNHTLSYQDFCNLYEEGGILYRPNQQKEDIDLEEYATKQVGNYIRTSQMEPETYKFGRDVFDVGELRIRLGERKIPQDKQKRVIDRVITWMGTISEVYWEAENNSRNRASFPLRRVYLKITQEAAEIIAEKPTFFVSLDTFLRDTFDWLRVAYAGVSKTLKENGFTWRAPRNDFFPPVPTKENALNDKKWTPPPPHTAFWHNTRRERNEYYSQREQYRGREISRRNDRHDYTRDRAFTDHDDNRGRNRDDNRGRNRDDNRGRNRDDNRYRIRDDDRDHSRERSRDRDPQQARDAQANDHLRTRDRDDRQRSKSHDRRTDARMAQHDSTHRSEPDRSRARSQSRDTRTHRAADDAGARYHDRAPYLSDDNEGHSRHLVASMPGDPDSQRNVLFTEYTAKHAPLCQVILPPGSTAPSWPLPQGHYWQRQIDEWNAEERITYDE